MWLSVYVQMLKSVATGYNVMHGSDIDKPYTVRSSIIVEAEQSDCDQSIAHLSKIRDNVKEFITNKKCVSK